MMTEGEAIRAAWDDVFPEVSSSAPSISPYLRQLEHAATVAGVSLRSAVRGAGVAQTTLMRWKKGEVHPREATAQAVLARIRAMSSAKAAAE